MADVGGVPVGMDKSAQIIASMISVGQETAKEVAAESKVSTASLTEETEDIPAALLKKQDNVKERIAVTRKEEAKEAGEVIPLEEVKAKSDEFSGAHKEHKAADLVSMQQSLRPSDKKEQILEKVKNYYKDPTLIKEALEFLLTTTTGELKAQVEETLRDFQVANNMALTAGENIAEVAKDTKATGLTPSESRQTYVEYLSSPEQDAVNKFFEIKAKHAGKDVKVYMNQVLSMLGAALHADSSSKNPSMERAELQRNISEIKIFQALIGVENFFEGRV